MDKKIKICFLQQSRSGVDYHRIEIPCNNLSKYKDLHLTLSNGFEVEHDPTQYDVIILNRLSLQSENYIERAKEAGVKIILDLDDWITIPEYHLGYHGIDTPIIEERIKESIGMADMIWCVSEKLRNSLQRSNAITIPNAIDFEQAQFIAEPQPKDRYTVGYIAGGNHHKDIERLMIPLQKLLGQKNYDILMGGYSPGTYWNYITTILTSAGKLPKDNFKRIDALDCYNYGFMYNYCDLMLAPLNNDLFSQCKSNLKVLEAGAFSLPIICSNVEPYKEFISQGLVYTSEGWSDRIKSLIKNPKPGGIMGKSLNGYIREHYDIKKINILRYESILNLI